MCDDIRPMLAWARIGLGIALVPKPSISLVEFGSMQYRDIDEESLNTRTAVIWLKSN